MYCCEARLLKVRELCESNARASGEGVGEPGGALLSLKLRAMNRRNAHLTKTVALAVDVQELPSVIT